MVTNVFIILDEYIGYHKACYQGGGTMYTEISQAESMALLAELSTAAEDGTLTEQQLGEAVRVHMDGRDGLFSVGLLWMRENTKHLSNLAFNLKTFLINHLDVGDFGSSLIHSRKVLEIVPEVNRAEVYQEIFVQCGDYHSGWIRDAYRLGVPKEAIAAMILERLRKCKVDPAINAASYIHDFLRYGAGHVERVGTSYYFEDELYTYWAALTDDQLVEAIEIAVERAPSLLFKETDIGDVDLWSKLSMRLESDTVASVQLRAARNTGGSAELAVRIALAVGTESDGDSPLTEFETLFTEEGTIAAFRSMWTTLQQAENKASAAFIEHWLLKRLEAFGYIYGQIEWGGRFDSKLKRTVGQLQITHEGICYVQDLGKGDYLPKVGDWVFIQPVPSEQLTHPATVAVPFIQAHSEKK